MHTSERPKRHCSLSFHYLSVVVAPFALLTIRVVSKDFNVPCGATTSAKHLRRHSSVKETNSLCLGVQGRAATCSVDSDNMYRCVRCSCRGVCIVLAFLNVFIRDGEALKAFVLLPIW